jgi:hypothetical protein
VWLVPVHRLRAPPEALTVKPLPPLERLHALFQYEDGNLYWKQVRGNRPAGALAGWLNHGRLQVRVDRAQYFVHRIIWLMVTGKEPQHEIDHIDGNPLNNKIENLRDVNHQVNQQNRRRAQPRNKTGFLGVYIDRGRYVAQITIEGRVTRVGAFDTPEAAHSAYLNAKRMLHLGNTL